MTSLGLLAGHRVVPVVVIDDADAAADLGRAIVAGGLGCAEVTMRTDAGLAALAAMAQVDGLLVGAGTVISVDHVQRVADAGAAFIVSPGFDSDVVDAARSLGLGVLPGVATATEMQRAISLGIDAVKLFPAHAIGGLDAVRAFAGPFPDLGVVPSGGVNADNAEAYLALSTVRAVSGSWMVERESVARRDFSAIEQACRVAARLGGAA
jgi:2-dehydro-3-deoxyphosphogluconate aldolase/(4S)-4-hydroxy-2-oxoglutarate aldolase